MNRCGPHPRLFHTWFRLVPGLFLAIFKRFCDYNIAFGVLRSGSVTHDTLNVAYATVVCTTCYRMFRERYTERWNGFGEPRVHRSVGPRRMQAAERRHPIAAQRHQPVSCGDAPHGSGESERWQHRHHHLPRTPFGTGDLPAGCGTPLWHHPVDVEQSARIDGTQRAYRARIRAEGRAVEENRAYRQIAPWKAFCCRA